MPNPAYSHVVAASGKRMIYTAGQVSIDERGALDSEDWAEVTAAWSESICVVVALAASSAARRALAELSWAWAAATCSARAVEFSVAST